MASIATTVRVGTASPDQTASTRSTNVTRRPARMARHVPIKATTTSATALTAFKANNASLSSTGVDSHRVKTEPPAINAKMNSNASVRLDGQEKCATSKWSLAKTPPHARRST